MGGRWLLGFLLLVVAGLLGVAFTKTGAPDAARGPGLDLVAPLENGVRSVVAGFASITDAVRNAGSFSEENRQLRRKIAELESEVLKLQEAGVENRQLRVLLNFERDNPGREYLPATIIAYDPSNLVRSVIIDRGSDHGLQPGSVVVTERGLLGKITQVSARAAKVLLVTDASSVVNGLVQRSRVQGVVTGKPDGGLALNYVTKESDLRQGDVVLSSGLGGGFPKGLPIGTVSSVVNNDQEPFQQVSLSPAVRASVLELVLVVKDFTPIKLP